jgi:two-component system, OmpR family, response regulator RegX3
VIAATATRPRVLLVEDETTIADPLVEALEREGFDVDVATTGHAALDAGDTDLILLDLGLPDIDGTDVCRALRSKSTTPIIVITARGDEIDRVLLLELGADDYVVKPFGLRELVARIRAVRRRVATDVLAPPAADIRLGSLHIDVRGRRVFVGEREVVLTPKEFELLVMLAHAPGAVLRREEIIEHVWDQHWWGPTKTLDVHIASLRKKLGSTSWITTVRGVGYRLDPQP